MNKTIYPSNTRGRAEHGWLSSRFSFSFAEYYDPERIHFGVLRVLNDDIIQPKMGFGMHPHDNMEIVSIPLSGALEHRDSMGNGSIIREGEIQLMSAGTGVKHSEFNPSTDQAGSFLQIWLFPKVKNIEPRYEQHAFDPAAMVNNFLCVVSPDGGGNSLIINQNAWFSLCRIEHAKSLTYTVKSEENGVYLFVIEGSVSVEGEVLAKRDAIGISETGKLDITAIEDTYLLLMDIPMR